MALILLLPRTTVTSDPVVLASSQHRVKASFDSLAVPEDARVRLEIQHSYDGGNTWSLLVVGEFMGGLIRDDSLRSIEVGLYTLCQCGELYDASAAWEGDPNWVSPDGDRGNYIGKGELRHSTVVVKANASSRTRSELAAPTLRRRVMTPEEEFKYGKDEDVLDRVFHVPSPAVAPQRQARVVASVLTNHTVTIDLDLRIV